MKTNTEINSSRSAGFRQVVIGAAHGAACAVQRMPTRDLKRSAVHTTLNCLRLALDKERG